MEGNQILGVEDKVARKEKRCEINCFNKKFTFNIGIQKTFISDDSAFEVALILSFEEAANCLELQYA